MPMPSWVFTLCSLTVTLPAKPATAAMTAFIMYWQGAQPAESRVTTSTVTTMALSV